LVGLLLLGGVPSCGYKTATARSADKGKSILIVPLVNKTTAFEVEQVLTRALARQFVAKSPYRVVNDMSEADLVMRGEIFNVSATPVIYGRETFGTAFLVTLWARVRLENRRTGKLVFRNDNYLFREQYEINPDTREFFSEQNPALERIASDFASSVVSTVLADF
jgi:hypothetical protein